MKTSSLVFLFALVGCTSWRVIETPAPAQIVARERPNKVLVTRRDGSLVILTRPDVRGDTLVGHKSAGLVLSDTAREIPVPLVDVQSLAVRRPSTIKTIGLVGGILVALSIIGGIGMAAE